MKKVFCPKCDKEMRLVSQGNVSRNIQKQDSKGRWKEIPQMSTYRMEFRCLDSECRLLQVFDYPSKNLALREVNKRFRAQHVGA